MKRFARSVLCLSVCWLLGFQTVGCGSVATRSKPPSATLSHDPSVSLFDKTDAELSDAEIARALNTRIELPDQIRIALFYLEHQSLPMVDRYWKLSQFQPDLSMAFGGVDGLRENAQVYDVSYRPDFLLASSRTLPVIRTSAARLQADWVMIFRTETNTDTNVSVFWGDDEARAYCVAECVVLDVRTGLFTFTSRARNEFTVKKEKDDWSMNETLQRAEAQAIGVAMAENVSNLRRFMEGNEF